MIAVTLDHVLRSAVERTILIVPSREDAVTKAALTACPANPGIRQPPLAIVESGVAQEGLAASLRAGLARIPPTGTSGFLVCLGDMPLVTEHVLDALIAAHKASNADVVVPVHDGHQGNPVLWHTRCLPLLAELRGDSGARRLLSRPAIRKITVPTNASVLADFDTPENIAAFARSGLSH